MNQQEVNEAGGPSDTTISKLENGLVDVVSRTTLRKLDVGLAWVPGSARALYEDGVEPVVASDFRPAEVPVGAGVDAGLLADLAELDPDGIRRVRDFMRGIKSGE